MKKLLQILFLLLSVSIFSQEYRATREKKFSLDHTKLKVSFNFDNSTMNGEAWVRLKPHFYEQNKLDLDAKSMLIHEVEVNGSASMYEYDGKKIHINLPKTFKKDEKFTVYVKYTAQPEKVKQSGSNAITSAKGLYFIDPKDEDPDKPTQVWTQGETEASSCWFPTIDAPNQKTSEEIYITVPKRFVTLSNGELISKRNNSDNTRTDYWKFNKKHAPYLFFMGIGEFEIIKDTYKGKPVNYYVEKKYAPYAQEIFGNTPEMLKYFSKITGVEYPWNKYSQIVCRDYVSGAMENTTAVIHGEQAYQVGGQLVDENTHENTIAHEAFHHWFGDLVTTESWSNLTVNESFANYSEYLWQEYKYGKDYADAHLLEDTEGYKSGKNFDKHLVRFHYKDKEDMFDAVSYNKGGAILHMLRNYVGDKAFFASIKKYLEDNKYKSAEAHQLRLVFEEVTGKDLNPFFNQWYFGSGHPKLSVTYDYNKINKEVTVNITQNQSKLFQFPLAIDIVEGKKIIKKNVFVNEKQQSFRFKYKEKPKYIQINADGVLLCDIEETKLLGDYINQFKYARNYKYKRDALLELLKNQHETKAFKLITKALSDKFYKIRELAAEKIDLSNSKTKSKAIKKLKELAKNDPKTLVRAAAIKTLGKLTDPKLRPIFDAGLKSKSFKVVGQSLVSIFYLDKDYALQKSKELPLEVKETIATPLTRIYLNENDESELEFIAGHVLEGMYLTSDKEVQSMYGKMFHKIAMSNNNKAIKNLTNDIVRKGKLYKKYGFDQVGIQMLKAMITRQKQVNVANKEKNIKTIQLALEQLIK